MPAPRKPDRPRRPRPVEEARKRLEPDGKAPRAQPAGPKRWGKVARQGAGTMKSEDETTASGAWRDAMKKSREREKPPAREESRWVEHRPKRQPRKQTAQRARDATITPDIAEEISRSVQQGRGPRVTQRLKQAADAFERERFQDALRLLKPLAEIAPTVPAVRELYGLTLYRMARYRDAAREIRAYIDLTGETDQHPVLADCYRALKRWKPIDELWDELRQASPSAELVAEGRIVTAGAKADRGDLPGAIALLEQAKADPKRPRDHHMRVWYALADLYDRAGDVPRARDLFRRIDRHDPEFFDTRSRLRALQ